MPNRKRYGRPVVCQFCRTGGGTLEKAANGLYQHRPLCKEAVGTRRPTVAKTPLQVARPRVVLPTRDEMRRLGLTK